jgi:hypothetical protein
METNGTNPVVETTAGIVDQPLEAKKENAITPEMSSREVAEELKKQGVKLFEESPEVENTPQEVIKKEKLQPLDFWKEDEKELFTRLEKEDQEKVVNMFNGMKKVYDHKTAEAVEIIKQHKDLETLASHVEEYAQGANVDANTYLNYLIDADIRAKEDPVGLIADLIIGTGVTPDQLNAAVAGRYDEAKDPVRRQIQPLRQELSEMKAMLAKNEPENNIDRTAELIDEVKNEVNEYGQLIRPDFQILENDMAKYITETGDKDLKKAYAAVKYFRKNEEAAKQAQTAESDLKGIKVNKTTGTPTVSQDELDKMTAWERYQHLKNTQGITL